MNTGKMLRRNILSALLCAALFCAAVSCHKNDTKSPGESKGTQAGSTGQSTASAKGTGAQQGGSSKETQPPVLKEEKRVHLTEKLTASFPAQIAPPFRLNALSSQGTQVLLTVSKGKEKPDRVPGFTANTRFLLLYNYQQDSLKLIKTFEQPVAIVNGVFFDGACYYTLVKDGENQRDATYFETWRWKDGQEKKLGEGACPYYHWPEFHLFDGHVAYFDVRENQPAKPTEVQAKLHYRTGDQDQVLATYQTSIEGENYSAKQEWLSRFYMSRTMARLAYLTEKDGVSYLNTYDAKEKKIIQTQLSFQASRLYSAGPYVAAESQDGKTYALYDTGKGKLRQEQASLMPQSEPMGLYPRPGGEGEAILWGRDQLAWMRLADEGGRMPQGSLAYKIPEAKDLSAPKGSFDQIQFIDDHTLLLFYNYGKQDLWMDVMTVS